MKDIVEGEAMEDNRKNRIKRERKNFFEGYHYFESNLRYVKLSLTWFLLSFIANLFTGIGAVLFTNDFIQTMFEFLFIITIPASIATLIYLFFNIGILVGDIKVSRDWD